MARNGLRTVVTGFLFCWPLCAADDLEELRTRAGKPAMIGDVQVAVIGVRVQRVGITSKRQPGQTKEEFLQVTLAITNRSGSKSLDYRGWGVEQHPEDKRAVIRDELGNRYRGLRFQGYEITGQHYDETILPHRKVVDQLVFQPPAPQATYFVLELPGEAVGIPDQQCELVFRKPQAK